MNDCHFCYSPVVYIDPDPHMITNPEDIFSQGVANIRHAYKPMRDLLMCRFETHCNIF